MNDPIPPRPRAAITGDSRLGTREQPRPASRPRASMRTTAPPPGPCPLQATGGRATLQPSSLHVAGRPASQPVVQLQGPSAAPAPGTHPPARAVPRVHSRAGIQQQLRQHVISRHSTREDRSEPIAGAVSGAARLAQSSCTDTRCATTGAGAASALCAASWGAAPDPRSSPQPRVGASGGGSSTSCILTCVKVKITVTA